MLRAATALALAAAAALVAPAAAATTAATTAATAVTQDAHRVASLRAFAAAHRPATGAPLTRAAQPDVTASSAAGDGCVKDTRREGRDGASLDVASTALVRCDGGSRPYLLKVGTYEAFETRVLDGLLVVLDTDVDLGTGCQGEDFFVIGYVEDGAGLLADVVRTPDCDDSTWTYRGEARIDRTADGADVIRMGWDAGQIDSPRDVRYLVDLTDGTTFDSAPDAGTYLLSPDAPARTYPEPVARAIGDTCDTQVGRPFVDTIGTTHAYSINCASGRGITQGRTAFTYEPEGTLTRGQTATFLANTLAASGFTNFSRERTCQEDDVHADSMSGLIAIGVIPRPRDGGCDLAGTIDRELMALWTRNALAFALAYGDRRTDWYSDDDLVDHEAAVDELTSLGVVTGKGDALYGPGDSLKRGQMATFLARSLDAMRERRQ